ncbi:hypothetical protein [Streptomyces indicus]|uniref:LPXTG-motif cell wall anchor domain-containing protein n=1 Tax=Streptomyces indicus TaxID=417292 RepID=A0A1G9DTK1_9ACTN|nr:hypothetical protein [Streptomyces indicus]SDK67140.1 hypothetical protein SAMN05421806_11046 [Streptomyces indicus]
MRLRSAALAVGVSAAALTPAVVAVPATADSDPLLKSKTCLSVALLGLAQECGGAGAADTSAADSSDTADATDASDAATDVGTGEDVGAVGEPYVPADDTDTSGTDEAVTDTGDADAGDADAGDADGTGTDTTGTDTTGTDTGDADTSDATDAGTSDSDTTGTDATGTDSTDTDTDAGASVVPAVLDPAEDGTDTSNTGTGDSDTGNTPVVTSVEQPRQAAVQPPAKQGLSDTTAGLQSTCSVADSDEFPIESTIQPGPKTYHPGGGFENWSVTLTNTSDDTCRNIHPLVVFLDRDRDLQSSQAEFEFRTPDGKWHPVPFERTDVDEHVGVFDDGFGGFSIPAGESVTVPVRLRFTADTQPNRVTASLAVVQRQDDDGEWVGESEDYVFTIAGSSERGVAKTPEELAETGRGSDESLLGLGVTAGAFLLGGGALVVGSRRLIRRR